MHAPFRHPYQSAIGPQRGSFHAKSTKIDLSMGVTFGRSMAGFTGMGTIEVVPAGVRIVARRYRYVVHLAAAVGLGLGVMILIGVVGAIGKTGAQELELVYKGAAFWGVVAAVLGAWIASATVRFTAPVTALFDRMRIQHIQMLGPRLRIFANDGDVEVWIPEREGLLAIQQALVTLGVPLR